MDNKVKSRAWVKDAAIIFLAVLLVLTFFSSTIMNRSLTEAATAEVKQGTITAKVRGKGIVEANGANKVKANSTVTIAKVMVKAGDEVKTDDVLFILGAGDSDELSAAKETLEDLQVSYDQAINNLPVQNPLTSNAMELEQLRTAAENALSELTKAQKEATQTSDPKIAQKVEDLLEEKELNLAQIEILKGQISDINSDIAKIEGDVDAAKKAYDDAYNKYAEEHPGENPDEDETVKSAKEKWASETDKYYSRLTDRDTVQYQIDTLETRNTFIENEILSWTSDPQGESLIKEKQAEYDAAALKYQSALDSYSYQVQSQYQSSNSSYLAAQAIALKIERQKEKIKTLAGEDPDNTIVAKTAGIVSEVNVASGDTVVKGDILAVIEVPDMGYTISFSVTNDQARRLKIGDKATISNFYWGNEITATLKSIATDKKNPQTQKTLTFDITGDVSSGAELTVSVGQKSASYDLVVPNSAVKSDNNGSFVYAVEAKNSPLGNRYIAKRVKVEVLASDDTNSAVTADMESGDFVVTTTGAPIKNGEQIRLANTAN